MRIAYLTQPYPPMISGAAIFAEQLGRGMANRRHQVLVIAASDRKEAYYSIEENLTVLRLASVVNPMRVNQRSLLYPRRAVMQALKEFQPDVIHTHEPLQMGWLGLEHARRAKIPITLTVHQLPWFVASYLPDKAGIRSMAEALLWEYARGILRKFTLSITPTKTIAHVIKARVGVQTKVIPYGIDLQVFHPDSNQDNKPELLRKLNIPLDTPIILHVGRLDADKCVERVVLASGKTMQQSNAYLLIVGDGRQKPALIDLCKKSGIESRVRFTGFISSKEELAKIYRLANVFVTASEIETLGIVLLEAAASGLPITAVRATCIPEIVQDGINGYLSASGNLDGMSGSLGDILNKPHLANAFGKAGRTIAEKYDLSITYDKHEKLYQFMMRYMKGRRFSPIVLRNGKWLRTTLLDRRFRGKIPGDGNYK